MPQKDPSRTEQATQKKRDEARKEGNVPKSEEVSKVAVTLAGLIMLRFLMGHLGAHFQDLFHWVMGTGIEFELTRTNVFFLLTYCLQKLAWMLLPIFLVLVLVSFLSIRLQVGQLFTAKVFQPKLAQKFNIIKGLQNIFFSMKMVVNVFKSLFQMAVIAGAAYLVLKVKMADFIPLFYQSVTSITAYVLSTGFQLAMYALLPMLLLAAIHFFYTRWDYEENLKMTKDEVKDERKQSYGNPEVKQAQRQKMQSVLQQRMMTDVPKADVVITNPVHLAVALRYDPVEAPAPVVLAKGANQVAERIKEVAREHRIPIKEDKPLAQALYKSVDVGEVIPEELYQAVASILAQLHSFQRRQGQ